MIGREDREMPDWARSLLEFEESMAGKSSARWAKTNGLELTGLAILLSATLALFGSGPFPNGLFDMASIAIEGGRSTVDSCLRRVHSTPTSTQP